MHSTRRRPWVVVLLLIGVLQSYRYEKKKLPSLGLGGRPDPLGGMGQRRCWECSMSGSTAKAD